MARIFVPYLLHSVTDNSLIAELERWAPWQSMVMPWRGA